MIIILSQKIDTESSYSGDDVFRVYHYPGRYRNQINTGDIFIYYQGNRYDKSQRYYFGTGKIGSIRQVDEDNYFAELLEAKRFVNKVPIYLPEGGYVENLGFETVRKSQNPPWQSSIRPLSQAAFDFIINSAGIQRTPVALNQESVEFLKEKLKTAIREFYVSGDTSAIHRIERLASAIGRDASIMKTVGQKENRKQYFSSELSKDKYDRLIKYCKTMRMTYSYKPLLILALLDVGKNDGTVSIQMAADYFRSFYEYRKSCGLKEEKKKCIYLKDNVSINQIISNLIANPVKSLVASGFFFYNEEEQIFSISPDIWSVIKCRGKTFITRICKERLEEYYSD